MRAGTTSALRFAASVAACAAFYLAAALFIPSSAFAGALTLDEQMALARGEVVARKMSFDSELGHYVGGVSYVIVRAPARDVMDALEDVKTYTHILPLLKEANVVGKSGGDPLVTLVHQTRIGTATYTVRVRRETPTLLRFWMSRAYPADLDDCWGFFRVTRIDRDTSLFTYGALLNLGMGFAHLFFESKIQGYALSTPDFVRRYVEERHREKALLVP